MICFEDRLFVMLHDQDRVADVAELLVSTAQLVGNDRAIAAAQT